MGIETAILATAVVGAGAGVMGGLQQKKAYKQQAEQAKMAAQANITDRTRALNEAMAMQNAMMGYSGRTMDSVESVIKGDEKRFKQDVQLIKAGAASQAAQYRSAGTSAAAQGVMGGVSQLGQGMYQYTMLGNKTKES